MNIVLCSLWNDVDFCPDINGLAVESVCRLITTQLFNEAADSDIGRILIARYEQMRGNFRDVHFNDGRWNLPNFNGCVCTSTAQKPDARLKVPQQYFNRHAGWFDYDNLGHDLPVWFCKDGHETGRRIMIVSVDPKRTGDISGALYLGTPFGFHSHDYRCSTRTDNINLLVMNLINDGAVVYLTDIAKLYATDRECKIDIGEDGLNVKGECENIIENEIDAFDPELIITLGNDVTDRRCFHTNLNSVEGARNGLCIQQSKVRDRIDAIAAYHPNPRRRQRIYLGRYGTLEDYYEALYSEIRRWMDER